MAADPELSNVEAQRVLSVFDMLAEDVERLFVLPPAQTSAMQSSIPDIVGPQFERMFEKHAQLEGDVAALLARMSTVLADLGPGDPAAENEPLAQEYLTALRAVKKSSRELARTIRMHPDLEQKLASLEVREDMEGDSVYADFMHTMGTLREQLKLSLATSVEDRRTEQEQFVSIAQREKRLAQESKSLAKELNALRVERHKAVSIRDDQIAQFKAEMAELNAASARAVQQAKTVAANKPALDSHAEQKQQLTTSMKTTETEMEKSKAEQREKEEALRKRSYKKETDVEAWVTKYDGEMSELQKEFDELLQSYKSEKARMREIEDHFDRHRLQEGGAWLAKCDGILIQREEDAKTRRFGDAATMIQSVLRSHLLRKELKEKGGKKGKKGKGKGKKK